jgi:hypothetical protein
MVFAADSATSIDGNGMTDENGDPIQQVYRHATKVFQLHRKYPIMAMTAGIGSFGATSIAMLAKQFRCNIGPDGSSPLGSDYQMEDVVTLANRFFLEEEFAKHTFGVGVSFELWIGGYSSGEMQPELWKLSVFNGEVQAPTKVAGTDDIGIFYGGQPDPIMRLVNGFGYKLEQILTDNAVTIDSHPQLYEDIPTKLFLPLVHPAMPIQDAIDLTEFLADVTKKVFRFRAVAEYVSGDIDVASVTKYENFRWIKRKHYYPHSLNQQVDHV